MIVIYRNFISILCKRNILCSTSSKNLVVCFILSTVFIIEFITYYCGTFGWYPIECLGEKSKCTRVLLVADPQLIGWHNEEYELLTPISAWDNDRYLGKTFSNAFYFSKPDVIVFLGDLLDEGSTATEAEFNSYLRRLFNIFLRKPFNEVKHIWLPGDNDIGGEGYDRITKEKVKRFEHAFSQPEVMNVKNLRFYKVNRLLSLMPIVKQKNDFSQLDIINIIVSHIPMILSPAPFVDKVLEKLQPHLLFTAHTHKSMIVMMQQEFNKDRLIISVRPDENQVYEYLLGTSEVYEVLVPTCSYRMGTDKIGYGLAVIENGTLRYTVLWSPSRFLQLYMYLYALVFIFVYLSIAGCCRYKRKNVDGSTYRRLNQII